MLRLFLFAVVFCFARSGKAQDSLPASFAGRYYVDFYHSRIIEITKTDAGYTLNIVGQGRSELIPKGGNVFAIKLIPSCSVEFIKDSTGVFRKFRFSGLTGNARWQKKTPDDRPGQLAGKYVAKSNRYEVIGISGDSSHIFSQVGSEEKMEFHAVKKNTFSFRSGAYQETYEFVPDKKGRLNEIRSSQSGDFYCLKDTGQPADGASVKHSFITRNHFTEADTLLGTLSPARACYDVLFYDLDLRVDPENKSVAGTSTIRFRAVARFDSLQIDLFANMKIDSISFHGRSLTFSRRFDAVFVHFPQPLEKDAVDSIAVIYSGAPQIPDMATLSGGFIWARDKKGNAWIESVCQGSGASLWWPCKDHLSDKPDSMRIAVTVPAGLTAVSNGQFVSRETLPGDQARFTYRVSYPINTYDAVVYIGDYIHFSGPGSLSFPLNYYALSYHREKMTAFTRRVIPMLSLYQQSFGPYPFPRDGFALVESPYGMEHQSAVSFGTFEDPGTSRQVPDGELDIALWHESAHEWWGNAVTCSDYADFWIHESFATYAEILCIEKFKGVAAARDYLAKQHVDNTMPIIGYPGINDFHTGDVYAKGGRMLRSLRTACISDSVFFDLLKGIQDTFRYRSTNTDALVAFCGRRLGKNVSWLFDQYLRETTLPVLQIRKEVSGDGILLHYRWTGAVPGFELPVRLLPRMAAAFLIYPADNETRSLTVPHIAPADLEIDTIDGYFTVSGG